MDIAFKTTSWLTIVGIDDNGLPLFEDRPHRVATADIGLPDGKLYSHWMPLPDHIDRWPDELLERIDRDLTNAVNEAAAMREP